MVRNGQPYNAVTFCPRRNHLALGLRRPETEEMTARMEATGIETQPYDRRERAYRFRLSPKDVISGKQELTALIGLAI